MARISRPVSKTIGLAVRGAKSKAIAPGVFGTPPLGGNPPVKRNAARGKSAKRKRTKLGGAFNTSQRLHPTSRPRSGVGKTDILG